MLAPGGAAVGGLEDQVGVVVRKATTAFVHTGDVHGPAARHVAGDLHVADEGTGVGSPLSRCSKWRRYQWSGVTTRAPLTYVKVVPGNIHVPEEGRGWVVVRPARFAVVAAAGVNARNGSSYSGPRD